jgi:hypothetical protein
MEHRMTVCERLFAVFLSISFGVIIAQAQASISAPNEAKWQSPARWHQLAKKATPGTLVLDETGVVFRSAKFTHRWRYEEISTFELTNTPLPAVAQPKKPHDVQELIITGYENRHWHEPGERRFRFTLAEAIPPAVAGVFTDRVGRPVRNGNPDGTKAVLAELPAHHRERFGGSNGTLRMRPDGIDYVTADGRDSRSWRWSDIQTLANPDPYEFRLTGYREIAEFDLKKPLSRDLFDKLWDILYGADLNVAPPHGVHHQ